MQDPTSCLFNSTLTINGHISDDLTIFDAALSKPFHGLIRIVPTVVHCVTFKVFIYTVLVCTLEVRTTGVILFKICERKMMTLLHQFKTEQIITVLSMFTWTNQWWLKWIQYFWKTFEKVILDTTMHWCLKQFWTDIKN